MVNSLLEMFIAQTKGYRMEIIKSLREPNKSNHQEQGVLELSEDGSKLKLKENC